jgi:hypothetical protein
MKLAGDSPVEVLRQHPWPPTKWSEFDSRQRVPRLYSSVGREHLREDQKAHSSTLCAAIILR